jgi:hypothetical protein
MRILTGDICLEDHSKIDYDLILSGQRPQLTSSFCAPKLQELVALTLGHKSGAQA